MKSTSLPSAFGIGLAIFSMFFGAGNSIFPLYVGYISDGNWVLACFGLLLTAVLMPILGIVGILRAGGYPLRFFGRLGRIPGMLVALLVISLLGPLGSTPRCIALSYATLVQDGGISMTLFSALVCILLFFCSLRKKYILPIIGYVLTPILLLSLLSIIGIGIWNAGMPEASIGTNNIFLFGLSEGYKTMDLLAAFFFSSTILHLLQTQGIQKKKQSMGLLLRGGIIGGTLLGLVYAGFCFVAAANAESLFNVPQEQLLRRIAELVLGIHASMIVKIAIAVACLTTAIALITAFCDFIQTEVLKKRVSYPIILALSLLATFCVAIFEFTQISRMLSPILSALYPGLIILTLFNCVFPSRVDHEKVSAALK